MQALLEDERNLNASHCRKPFRTSSFTRLVTPVPHNFGLRIESKSQRFSSDNQVADVGDIEVPEREKEALQRTAIKRKILDLKLGQLVRNEYETQEKEKFLSGHFCCQNSNISAQGDRIQLRKSAAVMREWSKELFSDLSADWPNLKFKIMLQNILENRIVDGNGNGLFKGKEIEEENIHTTAADCKRVNPSARGRRYNEGADELLIQFETDSQNLPPEGALNRSFYDILYALQRILIF